jgi:preprotein translocase subunit SecG
MIGFIIVIHIVVCALLIMMILIQRGRGSGLVESFSGVESMFGTKTSAFLARTTTILSVLFFLTCLSLAILSARQSRSLMQDLKAPKVEEKAPLVQPKVIPKEETQAPAQAPTQAAKEVTTQSQETQSPKQQETPKAE